MGGPFDIYLISVWLRCFCWNNHITTCSENRALVILHVKEISTSHISKCKSFEIKKKDNVFKMPLISVWKCNEL